MATAIYAVIDRGLDRITMSNAGHLPPVAVTSDRPARLSRIAPDLPIGAYPDVVRTVTTLPLRPGDGLFFYTDGLVERREPITNGLDKLTAALRDGDADQQCTAAVNALLGSDPVTDDVAILALRRPGPH